MAYCTRCGKKTQKGDVFCRKCGANLEGLVDEAAQGIKRELLAQISKIEEEIKNGKLTVDEFHAEANEIRQRLLKFIQK
jgi:uncharacterized membrane protein YvbJ